MTIYQLLQTIYKEYGYRKEGLTSLAGKGKSGTKPKIKFYFGVKGDDADAKIERLKEQFIK